MIHNITYKGLPIEVQLNNSKNGHYIRFNEEGYKSNYVVLNPSGNGQLKDMNVSYLEEKLNLVDNSIIGNSTKIDKYIEPSDEYNYWYNLNLTSWTGTLGYITFAPATNTVMQLVLEDDNAICFNPINNYEPFQPVIFECDVTSHSISVSVTDVTEGMTLLYSINSGNTWESSNIFEELTTNTEYNVWVKTSEDGWSSKQVIKTEPIIEEE